jgi:K(+)-stimulated pyrophosphate-energized sodium pump
LAALALFLEVPAFASEAELKLPDLSQATFFGSIDGRTLLMFGLGICALGFVFALVIYQRLRKLPVQAAMLEISELIYETCKTYLFTPAEIHSGSGAADRNCDRHLLRSSAGYGSVSGGHHLIFSLIGIAGSVSVAWFGIRVNTFANSRTAFASLRGKPYPCYDIPLQAGMSIGMLLISVELFLMLCVLEFVPNDLAFPCFIGFAIGESLGAAALRVAGGIFTKIADIGSD